LGAADLAERIDWLYKAGASPDEMVVNDVLVGRLYELSVAGVTG
jgi:hypothetical protein